MMRRAPGHETISSTATAATNVQTKQDGPREHGSARTGATFPPQGENQHVPQHGDEAEHQPRDAGNGGRLVEAEDGECARQDGKQGQSVAEQRHPPAQLEQADQAGQQPCQHQTFNDSPDLLAAFGTERQPTDDQRKIPGLNREKDNRGPGEQRGGQKDRLLAGDEEADDGDAKEHRDAENDAAKKCELTILSCERRTLPQGELGQAGRGQLQCECLRRLGGHRERQGIGTQRRQLSAASSALVDTEYSRVPWRFGQKRPEPTKLWCGLTMTSSRGKSSGLRSENTTQRCRGPGPVACTVRRVFCVPLLPASSIDTWLLSVSTASSWGMRSMLGVFSAALMISRASTGWPPTTSNKKIR